MSGGSKIFTSKIMKKTILFTPIHPVAAREMLVIARHLKRVGAKVHFWARSLATRQCLIGEGVSVDCVHPFEIESLWDRPEQGFSIVNRIKSLFVKMSFGKWIWASYVRSQDEFESRVQNELISFEKEYESFSELFDTVKPDIVAASSDRGRWDDLTILRLCRERGVPSVLIPFSIAADKEDMPLIRRDMVYEADLFPEIRDKYPAMVAEDYRTGERRFFYAPWTIVALDKMGLLPEDPWVQGGGNSDIVLVDGELAKRRLVSFGCIPEKIRVTGMASYDSLFKGGQDKAALRNTLNFRYGFVSKSPLVIFAVPVFFEHKIKSWDENHRFLTTISKVLRGSGCNLLISLHPKMDRSRYLFFEEYGFSLAEERLAAVLPAADVFLTTVSSTSLWAAGLGIAQIILNDTGLPDTFYRHLPNTFFDDLSCERSFESLLRKTLRRASQNGAVKHDGIIMLDGRATERIVDLLMGQ